MAKKTIKTRQFEIPAPFVGGFFSRLEETELDYSLVEVDQVNDELIVEVEYSPEEREEVMNLIELLDEYYDENTEEEEEEEEEPEDEG